MEDDNQAWHKAATKVFKPGTPRRRHDPQQRADHDEPARPAGATRTTDPFDELIRTGVSIRKGLDAPVHNLFKGNATVIGEWATASHVDRKGTRKAKPAAA